MLQESDVEALHPLSPQQQGMLFEWLRAPESGVHVEQSLFTLDDGSGQGGLDLAAFQEAWGRLAERHAILRTAFVWENRREPLQVVLRRAEIPIAVEDWRERPVEAALAAFLEADARQGLPLHRAPLMRLALFRCGSGRSLLVWTSHHILLDGWSRSRIFGELLPLYGALARGEAPPVLPPVRPYGDYVSWLGEQDTAAAAGFWRRQLAGLAGPSGLPLEEGRAASVAGERYGSLKLGLGAEATRGLEELARRRRVTLSTVVQGALGLLLARYGGREDVLLGITVSGRPGGLQGVEEMVGPFLNTLPLRLAVPEGGAFDAWLGRVQAAALALASYQHCSEGQVHAWSGLPPSAPLYEAVLVFENYPLLEDGSAVGELGFRISGLEQRGARTKYLLTFLVFAEQELSFELVYDGRRLGPEGARRVADQLAGLLRTVAQGPGTDLGALRAAIADEELPRCRPATAGEVDSTPPRTAVERLLAPVWARVLGVEGLGVHASFLELGGHSLLALELAGESRRALGCEVPLRLLFTDPSVAGVAAAVLEAEAGQAPETVARIMGPGEPTAPLTGLAPETQDRLWEALVAARSGQAEPPPAPPHIEPRPGERHEPFPLTGIQTLYWQARGGLAPTDTHGNNLVVEFEIPGAGEGLVAALEAALGHLVERHAMLRAVFSPDGTQRVLPEVPRPSIRRLDLRSLAAGEAEARVAALRFELRHRRAAPDRWPLFEVIAHLLPGERLRLQLRMEALLLDGDSRERLFQELLALVRRPDLALPPLGVTFRDYAVGWRRLAAQHGDFRRSRQYWLGRLPHLPAPATLPTRGGGPPWPRRFALEKETARLLPAGEWAAVKTRAGERGLTPSAVVAGAFAAVLGHAIWGHAARDEPGGGRSFTLPVVGNFRPPFHPDLEGVVGNFDTLYPVAVRDAAAPLVEIARQLQEELMAALEHPYFFGPEALLQLARRHPGTGATPAVVFNSLVEFNHPQHRQRLLAAKGEAPLGEQIDLSINIPQVIFNGTIAETLDGDLIALWQWMDEALAPGVAAEVRDGYRRLLVCLARAPEPWDLPFEEAVLPSSP